MKITNHITHGQLLTTKNRKFFLSFVVSISIIFFHGNIYAQTESSIQELAENTTDENTAAIEEKENKQKETLKAHQQDINKNTSEKSASGSDVKDSDTILQKNDNKGSVPESNGTETESNKASEPSAKTVPAVNDDNLKQTEPGNENKIPVPALTPKGRISNLNGLLEIKDGSFKYARIPGITLQEKKIQYITESLEPVKEESEQSAEPESEGKETGLSSLMIKIILAVLILGIFILFRFRSKARSNKVLRRFPGA